MILTARHLIPLMVLAGMFAISMAFVRLMLALIGRPFRHGPPRPGDRRPPPGPGPLIDGSYVDLTPPAPRAERSPQETPPTPPAGGH